MTFNLKEKCETSKKKEFYYGAKINKSIKDAYLGICFLEANEKKRKIGPGKGHEEILYVNNGKIKLIMNGTEILMNEGDAYHIPDGEKIIVDNLTGNRCYLMIAGGHIKHHSH